MNELEAAIGLGNIDIYHDIFEKRRQNLLYILERFKQFDPYLTTIEEASDEKIGPHAIPIIIQEEASFTRAELTNYLEKHGIETRTLFASMPTQCVGFAYLGYTQGQFPNAEYIGKHGIHIGVHQDGLVHISQLADRFVKNPNDVVTVQQKVTVRIIDIDLERNRISLSMKTEPAARTEKERMPRKQARRANVNQTQKKTVKKKRNAPFHNPFEEALGNRRK